MRMRDNTLKHNIPSVSACLGRIVSCADAGALRHIHNGVHERLRLLPPSAPRRLGHLELPCDLPGCGHPGPAAAAHPTSSAFMHVWCRVLGCGLFWGRETMP
jgi:hypothetical protein